MNAREKMPRAKRRLTHIDYLVALFLFGASVTVLGMAQRTQGTVRDEGMYFDAAKRYWGWFEEAGQNLKAGTISASFTRASIDRYWAENSEHPVLMKTLFAFSYRLFHGKAVQAATSHNAAAKPFQPRLSEISSFRLPAWVFAGLAVFILYLWGIQLRNRVTGLAAALLYLSMPQTFFHSQLTCFDAPVTTMTLLVVYAYYRSLTSRLWGILTGIFWGLALATKHNAWFIPAILGLHYLIVIWPDLSIRRFRIRIPLVFVSMISLGPLVFFLHWPWLWPDPLRRVGTYVGFHLHHVHHNVEYLGQNWVHPPFPVSYPFVTLLFTAPTILLTLVIIAWSRQFGSRLVGKLRGRRHDPDTRITDHLPTVSSLTRSWTRPALGLDLYIWLLLLLNTLFPVLVIALPNTPIFGGTKHYMTAYPFMALSAGLLLGELYKLASRAQNRKLAVLTAVLPLVVTLPGAINTYLTHPFGLSQYNALAGGPAGGADLGMQRQFWGYASRQLLPYMNQHLPPAANVYFHDTHPSSYHAYIRDGLLRPDIRYAGWEWPAIQMSSHALVIYELHFNKYDYWIWRAYKTATPQRVITLDGVPVVAFYGRVQGR